MIMIMIIKKYEIIQIKTKIRIKKHENIKNKNIINANLKFE